LLSIISFYASIFYGKFFYDGHHYGIIYDIAFDTLNNKNIYNDIFSPYGPLNVIINSFVLKYFSNNIFILFKISSVFYSLSFIFYYLLAKNFLSGCQSFLLVLSIFFIHPIVSYPWPNYLLFFLVCVFLLTFLSNDKKVYFLSPIFLFLISLTRENVIFFVYLSIFYFLFLIIIKNNLLLVKLKKKLFYTILLSVLFYILYILFLYIKNSLNGYLLHINIFKAFLEGKNENLINLSYDFLKYLIVDGTNKIITDNYILIFALSLATNLAFNLYLLFKKNVTKKDLEISFISVFSLFLNLLSINEVNIFRLVCGASIGFITIFYIIIYKIRNKYISNYLLFLFVFFSFSSLSLFYKNSSNPLYKSKNEYQEYTKINLSYFSLNIFEKQISRNLEILDEVFLKIKKNCNIRYFANLQPDIFFRIIAKNNFYTFQKIQFFRNKGKVKILYKYYDNEFPGKLQKSIEDKNIILIVDNTTDKYSDFINQRVYYNGYKVYYQLPYNYYHKNIKILTPENCY
jgi:hypothetical protein